MKQGYLVAIVIIISGAIFFGIGFNFGRQPLQEEIEKKDVTDKSRKKPRAEELIKNFLKSTEPEVPYVVDSILLFPDVCNEETVELNFRRWMDFNYPDYKKIENVVVEQVGDCSYHIRFTTAKAASGFEPAPGTEQVIVVQFDYTNDFKQFSIKILRGLLY